MSTARPQPGSPHGRCAIQPRGVGNFYVEALQSLIGDLAHAGGTVALQREQALGRIDQKRARGLGARIIIDRKVAFLCKTYFTLNESS